MTPAQLYIAKSGAKHAPSLPVESITSTFAILGQRGTGKTNSATVLVEEMVKRGGHVAVLDPVGAWWGATRAGDGGKGIPGIVLGGEHGDVPLEKEAGRLVAELVAQRAYPLVVIDLMLLRKGAQLAFMADYLETLFHLNRAPLHQVFEEADRALPQQLRGGDITSARVLGAGEDIVKLGRGRGLGASLISQRPATVNKNVLEQTETLLVHRLIGPNDRKAIRGWIEANGDPRTTAKVVDSLAGLARGEAWLYAPALDLLERVRMRARRTFDSSATPTNLDDPRGIESRTDRAPVDLQELRERMAATVERARANDPKALRARIAELERQLAERGDVEPERVEVPVLPRARFDQVEALVADAQSRGTGMVKAAQGGMERAVAEIEKHNEKVLAAVQALRVDMATLLPAPAPATNGGTRARVPRAVPARPRAATRDVPADAVSDDVRITPARQRILDALASLAAIGVDPAPKVQVALFAGASPKSSSFANNLGAMRTDGLIDYPSGGMVALTDAGSARADGESSPATREEMWALVQRLVKPAQWRILQPLIDAYPDALTKEELAERAEASVSSSSFANNVGALRSLGLLDYPVKGMVAAQPVLMLDV